MKKLLIIISLCIFVAGPLHAGKRDPIGVLFQVKGKVEYTKNGRKWKKVRRNKFLFAGYQIRTGPNGSGKITIKSTGKNFEINPNSIIVVSKKKLNAKKGTISATEASDKLMSGLMKRFTKSQSYTTVRRSHKKKRIKIDAVRKMTLSNDHPYIVWENINKGYNYELMVGNNKYNIPASNDKIVRYKVEPFTGEQIFKITVLKNGKKVVALKKYKSKGEKKDHTVEWLQNDEDKFQEKVNSIQETYGENSFMLGTYFEEKGMWVASMDQYKQYLQENPDEIEMTPYLFRVYKKLKLNKIYKKELEKYKAALLE